MANETQVYKIQVLQISETKRKRSEEHIVSRIYCLVYSGVDIRNKAKEGIEGRELQKEGDGMGYCKLKENQS